MQELLPLKLFLTSWANDWFTRRIAAWGCSVTLARDRIRCHYPALRPKALIENAVKRRKRHDAVQVRSA